MSEPRCALCSKTRRQHCDLDEPGIDHPGDCWKMHHTFAEPAGDLASEVRRQGHRIAALERQIRELNPGLPPIE
jgi:hypothetical protein